MQFTSIIPQTVICLDVEYLWNGKYFLTFSLCSMIWLSQVPTVSNYDILYLYWTQCQKHTDSSSNTNDSNNILPSQCLNCIENNFFSSSFDTVRYFLESWINISLKHNITYLQLLIHCFSCRGPLCYMIPFADHFLLSFCVIHISPLTGLHHIVY